MINKKVKTCTNCNEIKLLSNFYKSNTNKNGFENQCKNCRSIGMKKWRKANKEHLEENDYIYNKSEHGFVTTRIANIFKPSNIKKRGWKPKCTKKQLKQMFLDYVNKYGRLCYYCGEPWTYEVNRYRREEGLGIRTKGSKHGKNFSIDRFDSSKTYSLDNICFVHHDCNDRKKDITLSLIERLYEIIQEKKNSA